MMSVKLHLSVFFFVLVVVVLFLLLLLLFFLFSFFLDFWRSVSVKMKVYIETINLPFPARMMKAVR